MYSETSSVFRVIRVGGRRSIAGGKKGLEREMEWVKKEIVVDLVLRGLTLYFNEMGYVV